MTKIFWSWQSDIDGKFARHFVREALGKAAEELNEELTIEERVEVDHDRKGVPGSPDLVSTILQKIEQSDVLVADVTPVGKSSDGKRDIMNPNVAIELGYALAKLGDTRLLMVLNTHFGTRDSLPFDLRQKAGPIMFQLAPAAGKEKIARAQKELVGKLKIALKEYLHQPRSVETAVHEETPASVSVAQYFKDREVLAQRETVPELHYKTGPFLYVRLLPKFKMPELGEVQMTDLVFGIKLRPLNFASANGGYWGRNKYGAITYEMEANADSTTWLTTSSQLFPNREIWGIDTYSVLTDQKLIHAGMCERTIESGVKHYLDFATEFLGIEPPVTVEVGISRVQNYKFAFDIGRNSSAILRNDIQVRRSINAQDSNTVNSVLLEMFEKIYDSAARRRPENFRGFPPRN